MFVQVEKHFKGRSAPVYALAAIRVVHAAGAAPKRAALFNAKSMDGRVWVKAEWRPPAERTGWEAKDSIGLMGGEGS